jgi:hypothetical protein
MSTYSIRIPNEKAATYRLLTIIIALLQIPAFAFVFFNVPAGAAFNLSGFGLLLSVMAFVMYLVKMYTARFKLFRIEIAFIIFALIWFISGYYLMPLLLLLFAILGFYTNKKMVIHFKKEGILYPSFPPKTLLWTDVDFVVLKDGILSIEMKDNRLMQFTLDDSTANEIDSFSFNHFCKQQVEAVQ